jgi:hypothetical protein
MPVIPFTFVLDLSSDFWITGEFFFEALIGGVGDRDAGLPAIHFNNV